MPIARINGVDLFYEELGTGTPLVFAHEFYGDYESWHLQVRFFARRFRTITFNARGFPPSAVPDDPGAYSQALQVEDIKGLLDHLGIARAHICGLSMGAYTTLFFGLAHPDRARSLTIGGIGSGSGLRAHFVDEMTAVLDCLEQEGIERTAERHFAGPRRVQLRDKDPKGWDEAYAQFTKQSAKGHALTIREVLMKRRSILDMGTELERLTVPVLVIAGDEDEPCLEPGLFLKRKLPAAGLLVIPKAGHLVNLEEPAMFNEALLAFITAVDAGAWPARNPLSTVALPIYLGRS
ncbi:MAG TPA: alpha/beta fold hydrolase [Candidatus Methylomirabilis sp.]|nr:alpha/beta fold hydrolase [Candidatus Methylomirabilis sp.]